MTLRPLHISALFLTLTYTQVQNKTTQRVWTSENLLMTSHNVINVIIPGFHSLSVR